jgi:hypothetical protein
LYLRVRTAIMRTWRLAILCWAGCVSLGFAQQAKILGPEATQAALDEMYRASQGNFEKIRTWRGSWFRQGLVEFNRSGAAPVLDHMGVPADVAEVRGDSAQTIDFAFERASGRLFAHADDVKTRLTDGKSGEKVRTRETMWSGGRSLVWTPETYLYVRMVGRDKNGRFIHQGRRDRGPGPEDQPLLELGDPRRVYGFAEKRPAWESLAALRKDWPNRRPEEITAAAATQPNQVGYCLEQVRAESPRLYCAVWRGEGLRQYPGTAHDEFWFDEAVAFNMVRGDRTVNGVLRKHFEIAYERQQGVYLPKHVLREFFDADGRLQSRDEMTLTASTLNEALPPEQFSLKSLGLRDGERVIDKVNGGEYRYQGGTLTSQPAAKPAAGPSR